MTTRDIAREKTRPVDARDWVNLRNEQGRVQARYNRRTGKLVIVERGVTTEHDLRKFATPCETPANMLG